MADQKITELPIKNVSAIQLADYLLGIDSAEGYQMLISDLAKKIIEAYSGSSLGGAAQTLKSALDTVTTNAGNNLATIEASTTASKAYAVGDYLVLNGILYKVTTAIASGGTITVGTNVTVAAAGDDIAAIAAKIGNTSMGTTATTITGAIAEHEADISGLNSKIQTGTISANGSLSFSFTNFAVFIGFYSSGQNAIFGFRANAVAEIVKNGSVLTTTINGNTATINSDSSGGTRYFIFKI